jgi:site-specific DNA-adenine methylase
MNTFPIKSPYPFFGGKSRVAPVIWQAFGEVSNYVEPFAGSLAVLLANPKRPKIETVNDLDCFITNFWRAVSADPEGVAKFADTPVHEADLHARHKWLLTASTDEFKLKMHTDPDYYDLKIAGWWVWGMGASIGNNWLSSKGVNSAPILSSAGGGIHGLTHPVLDWFKTLQERTRRVRVCSGDWQRIMTPSVTYNNKGLSPKDITGVFLDPPYSKKGRDTVYKSDNDVYNDVCKWAIDNQDNDRMRIIVCGYSDDYEFPDTWKKYSWSANGGLANLGNNRGKMNAKKETIYFSPSCLKIEDK